MEFRIFSLFCVLIMSISAAQQSVYRDIFASYGTVIDSKKNFIKTVVSAITAPFRLPENQQTFKTGSIVSMAIPSGLEQQGVPSSSSSDLSFLAPAPSSGKVSRDKYLLLQKEAALSGVDGNQQASFRPEGPAHQTPDDMPLITRLVRAQQANPVLISLPNDEIAKLMSMLLQLFNQKSEGIDSKISKEGQTSTADSSKLSGMVQATKSIPPSSAASPVPTENKDPSTSPTPLPESIDIKKQPTLSISLPDILDNKEQSTP